MFRSILTALAVLLGLGAGLIVAAWSVRFRDVQHIIEAIGVPWFFLTPLVYSLDTTAFGAPYDMDRNGKVILFFTTAVNQLTPAGASSVIGGFFFERDMIPRVANQQVPFACATSNEGEMFYLPVVDANSRYNAYFKSKSTLLVEINGTTIHEFQHLINASRRYYVTPDLVDTEEAWLNEGMSHIAEEILYMHVAGLGQRQARPLPERVF